MNFCSPHAASEEDAAAHRRTRETHSRPQSPVPPYTRTAMPARPDLAEDVLRLAFVAASASPPLACSSRGIPHKRTRDALRRALSPASHASEYTGLLVFASLAADLLTVSHGRLTIAPAAAQWAAAPPAERRRALRFAVLEHPDAAARWMAARRPGFRLLRYLPPFAQLLPPARSFSRSALARRIGALSSDLLLSDSPASSITALVDSLSFAHTHLSAPPRRTTPPLKLHLSFSRGHTRRISFSQLVPAPPTSAFLELAALSGMVASSEIAINDDSLRRALDAGLSAHAILSLLDRCLPSLARPADFDAAVRRAARDRGRIHLHQDAILETRTAAELDEILRAQRARRAVLRTLSPRAVVVDPRRLPDMRRRLRTAPGFLDDTTPAEPSTIDSSDSLHLYLAARITHLLPDLTPLPWRPPHSLVARLERALSPQQRALAAAMLDEWRTLLAERPLPASWFALDSPRLDELNEPTRTLASLCIDAVRHGASLTFEYQGRDELHPARRSVEPLRVEWRRGAPYLVAFDHDAEEERTFRIDRMRAAARLPARLTR